MREDMERILVGRPRVGGRGSKGPGRGKDSRNMEDLPTKEGMKQRWKKGELKSLNENLSPFYRYLDKQVGRPWDEVYSEIRERINTHSAVQLHILQHLETHVDLHVVLDKDGTPYRQTGASWYDHEVFGLYVCPKSGLLKENKAKPWRQKTLVPNYLTIDGKHYFESEHGWFEIELIKVERRWIRNPTKEFGRRYSVVSEDTYWDALSKKMLTVPDLYDFYGRSVRCVSKRPLNKKEIKKLSLRE